MTPEKLRECIFHLNTRRFGKVSEVMIQKILRLEKAKNIHHDLFDESSNQRIEVKFSTVKKKNDAPITEKNLLQALTKELNENRQIQFQDWPLYDFDCNIQQVKRSQFDILYYGLFFADKVLVFRIISREIDDHIHYSDKQHHGNTGEGQFHISPQTLPIHLEKHLYKQLNYGDLLEILQ